MSARPDKQDGSSAPAPEAIGNDLAEFASAEGTGGRRPPGPDEIADLMRAAEQKAAATKEDGKKSALNSAPHFILWPCLVIAITLSLYVLVADNVHISLVMAAIGSAAISVFLLAVAFGARSPVFRSGEALVEDGRLASNAVLGGLKAAERVLDTDEDPRLITKRDGVVVYANQSYFSLAEAAGLGGGILPPRIDRLFGQQGGDASKVFKLCRAAKSGVGAVETLHQIIGLEGGGERKHFEIVTAPVEGPGEYVSWRIRELPPVEQSHDMVAAAFADYVRPVLALERSGKISWINAAGRKFLGVERGAVHHIDDIVLGETADIVRALCKVDQTSQSAFFRRSGGAPAECALTGFRRGGVGEGCVYVDFALAEQEEAAPAEVATGNLPDAPFGVAVVDGDFGRDAELIEANKAFLDAFASAAKGQPMGAFIPDAALDEIGREFRRKSNSEVNYNVDVTVANGKQSRTIALFARSPKRRRGGYGQRKTYLYTIDVTERKRMEADYAQDQKLKAIGNIAGEVAHDFNNLLQVVLSNCEDMMLRHPAGDPSYEDLVLIRENAQRAANLTKQLLAYSRKQTLTPKSQSITDLLLDFTRFLNRAVGEKVSVELVNGRGLPPVKVDRTQLETAIMNLAVNARDAMGAKGGTLTIETSLLAKDELKATELRLSGDRDFVQITVSDTGPGIPEDIIGDIFEPFFTTKSEGKGTGLGLSAVQGVIAQLGGVITVENLPGGGAKFSIYLPADETAEESIPAPASSVDEKERADFSGAGRILIVEDEEGVRFAVKKTLGRAGYELVIADDGVEALEILETDPEFNLIITDVMMPEVDGPTMVRRMQQELELDIPVIFMSGYAEASVRDQIGETQSADFIQKPFSGADLGSKVKKALRGAA